MSRNFGLGSRVMADAGRMALDRAAGRGEVSFSTAATQADRWAAFSAWSKSEGINRMEHITRETVTAYGQGLAAQVRAGKLAPATAQNYVSAVNSVMALATKGQWQSVSPTKGCGIEQRSCIRAEAPGALDRASYSHALNQVREQVSERAAAVVDLARELGLRSKEGSLLNARAALAQAERSSAISISEGTKGGLERTVPITTPAQMETLQRAAHAQGEARAVMPPDASWKKWRERALRDAREIVQVSTQGGLHDLRSAYACDRYEAMTGHRAPFAGGKIRDREADQAAREEIAQELGHRRAEVVAEYVGGR